MKSIFSSFGLDNIYKYLVIIGSAIFLSPSFLAKDLLETELKLIDMQTDQIFQIRELERIEEEQDELFNQLGIVDQTQTDKLDQLQEINNRQLEIQAIHDRIEKNPQPSDQILLKSILEELKIFENVFNESLSEVDLIRKRLDEIETVNDQLKELVNLSTDSLEISNSDLKKIDKTIYYLEKQYTINFFYRFIGASMVIAGFLLGYFKYQIYIDQAIKRDPKSRSKVRRRKRTKF